MRRDTRDYIPELQAADPSHEPSIQYDQNQAAYLGSEWLPSDDGESKVATSHLWLQNARGSFLEAIYYCNCTLRKGVKEEETGETDISFQSFRF